MSQPGERITFVRVNKSELKGTGYTVIVEVVPNFAGCIYPPLVGIDRRWANVQPSRRDLGVIFDAVGILPEVEKVEDLPEPKL
jgi:hypothetical protein